MCEVRFNFHFTGDIPKLNSLCREMLMVWYLGNEGKSSRSRPSSPSFLKRVLKTSLGHLRGKCHISFWTVV